jgi:6-phosphofructokinase 1
VSTGKPIHQIAILTGGGDAPGLNAVIRAVVKTAVGVYRWDCFGVESGFEGLLGAPQLRRLTPGDVRGLLPRGGTILGTTNRGHFHAAACRPGYTGYDPFPEALENIRLLGIDALVTIGGDGTQTIAQAFAERGVRVVGVPKTIDNDLAGTDRTFGFDTALELATDALDRLHTTAESHERVLVLEVMGRTAGWIALQAAIAGGADAVLIPELPFDIRRVSEAIRRRHLSGRRFSIVVVAEGAMSAGGGAMFVEAAGADSNARYGGIGAQVAHELGGLTGKETRVAVLGHLQRGGRPTALDRLLATCFGEAAVQALARGETGRVVVLQGNETVTIPLEAVAGRVRNVPVDSPLLKTALSLGIEFGADLPVDGPNER